MSAPRLSPEQLERAKKVTTSLIMVGIIGMDQPDRSVDFVFVPISPDEVFNRE